MQRLAIHPLSHQLILCALSAAFMGAAIANEPGRGTARMERSSISRGPKATRFAGASSMAQPGFCIRATARGEAHRDGQIAQMDTPPLSLLAQRVKSNLTVEKLIGFHSM
ncbi:MAG: hypothetical protein DME65_14150 [Verrucomicrobia bacterium]|nr:MAG: hypothetical protein DME65_14150 [Verrucomicrobiota bacterium]